MPRVTPPIISPGSPGRKGEAAAPGAPAPGAQGPGAPGRPGRPEAGWLQRLAGQLPAAVISCRRACAEEAWKPSLVGGGRAAELGGRGSLDRWLDEPVADGWMLQLLPGSGNI